jgi:ABC-type lipoprotein export system ATPase subunit
MTGRPINFYDRLPKNMSGGKLTYPNQKQINIDLPFRMMIVGASGSGKTNTLLNIIRDMGCFQKYYLFARNLDQPLYKFFISRLAEIAKKAHVKLDTILVTSETLEDVPPLEEINKDLII